jgi:DNA mismatch repair protein MutS
MKLIEDYIIKANDYIDCYGAKTVLLMQVGTFYEIYSLNDPESILYTIIHDISDVTGLSVVEKSICVGDTPVIAAGFRDYAIEKWVYKMQLNGYTCVVYSQDVKEKIITRNLTGIYTPGTYIDINEGYGDKKTNNHVCIWIEKVRTILFIGISNINIVTGKSQIYEYSNDYTGIPNMYDDIERYISVYNPSETTIISNLSTSLINSIIQYTNIQSITINVVDLQDDSSVNTIKARKCEAQKYQRELFNTCFEINNMNTFMEKYNYCEIATQSYCYLLNHLRILNPRITDNIYEPIIDNLTERLILANHSAKQLNIIGDNNGKYSSVLSFTDNTLTAMGKRLHHDTLLNPTTNIDTLKQCYDTTDYILQVDELNLSLRNELSYIKDIEKITKLMIMGKIQPKSIHKLVENFSNIKNIGKMINDHQLLDYLKGDEIVSKTNEIEQFITHHIDIKKCQNVYSLEDNIFNKDIFVDLDIIDEELHDSIDTLNSIVYNLDKLMNNKLNPKKYTNYIKLCDTEKSGFSIQTTKSRVSHFESIINEHIDNNMKRGNTEWDYKSTYNGISKKFDFDLHNVQVHKINNNIVISSECIQIICKRNLNSKSKLKEIIQEKYNEFLSSMKPFGTNLHQISNFIGNVDILQNRVYMASKFNYCKPKIKFDDISYIEAKLLRHPLVEQINTEEIYVANDIELGRENILLFGTNAVGKTSLIKSIGIAIILAQSGMYVPAKEFEFSPYKQMFTRILNCDNIFKGLSTFTLEMSEMSNIFKYATKNSLVLGDELCSGTELPSAMCIFISGLKCLSRDHVSFIFATHFHELLEFSEMKEIENVCYKHMSVKYDPSNDCVIYNRKLRDGSGDKIYGLEVCKSLDLPKEFMDTAFSILNKYYHKDVLSYDGSKYNRSKIKSICELCKYNPGEHIHHLLYQKEGVNDFINTNFNSSVHKNHTANLINICEDCHKNIHDKDIKLIKKKTTKGCILEIL